MNHKLPKSSLTGAGVAFLLAVCAVACPVTGFELNASLGKLILILFCFAVLCGFSLSLRHGALIPLGILALAAGFLWRDGEILVQSQSLLRNITGRFDSAYGIGVLCPGADWSGPVDLPLTVLGCLAVFVISWTVTHRKAVLYILPVTLPLLIVCLVVTDTPPHPAALLGLLSGLGALLLTDHVRRRDGVSGSRLLGMLGLPVLLAFSLLFLAQPPEKYTDRSEEFQATLVSLAERFQSLAENVGEQVASIGGDSSGADQLDLDTLGPRIQWDYPVMKVTAPVGGTLYLRGQDYNTYSGSGWLAARHRTETFPGGGTEIGTLTIETYGAKPVLYTPYYPAEDLTLVSGGLLNPDRLKTYSYTLTDEPEAGSILDDGINDLLLLAGSASYPDSGYRLLPTATLRWAKELAEQVTAGKDTTHDQAQAIAAYVRASAEYDLQTSRMDSGYEDFAQWFLTESDTGYCVHFATAATVLLRAADIPARYVEGFMFHAEAGQETTVTGKSAHAWAEYYTEGAWHVLEATPADSGSEDATQAPETGETLPDTVTLPEWDEPTPPQQETPAETQMGTSPLPGRDDGQAGFALPGWLRAILWLLLAAASVWEQSELRIRLKRRAWHRGRPNQRALNRFRQLEQLAALAKLPIPEELEMTAQKAKFSQHTLTKEELRTFEAFREACRTQIRAKGFPITILYRILFAVD